MRWKIIRAAVILGIVGLGVARYADLPRGRPGAGRRGEEDLPLRARVNRVLDGDSLVLQGGLELRYIGVDAPERGEAFAEEARAWNRRTVEGREIRLEYDEEKFDRYGRALGYAWISRGGEPVLVNAELVRAGLGMAYPNYPNFRYRDRITGLQKGARRAHKGIWSARREEGGGPFVGSRTRYHRPSCEFASKIRRPRRYPSAGAALDEGLSPCRACRP